MSGFFFFNPKPIACPFSLTLPSYPESSFTSQPRAFLGCSAFASEMSLFLREERGAKDGGPHVGGS